MIVSRLLHSATTALADPRSALAGVGRLGEDADPLDVFRAERGDGHTLSGALVFSLCQRYGWDERTLEGKLRAIGALAERFLDLYGDGPVAILRAPARINILGEHVDYVSYLPTASLPFGSRENDMIMLFRAAKDGRVRGASSGDGFPPFDFTLGDGPSRVADDGAEGAWLDYLLARPSPAPHWDNYVKGAAYFALVEYGERVTSGFDFVVDSSIPPSGGASSSSALVVLASAAVRAANNIEYAPGQLADDASRAEWYVGTRGGAMDHMTICLAKRARVVLISYGERRARLIKFPESGLRWVTFFSRPADKGREVMLEYNERAAVSRVLIPGVLEDWRRSRPDLSAAWLAALASSAQDPGSATGLLAESLGELPETLTLAEVMHSYPAAYAECERLFPVLVAERSHRPLEVRARALHHVGEVRRVAAAARILDDAGPDGADELAALALGELLGESHASLRDLYGVSTPEVESLVTIVRSDPKVYGARLMGGGFGGNVLALTTEDNVDALVERVQSEYYGPAGRDGRGDGAVMISTPGDGLSGIGPDVAWREAFERYNLLGPDAPVTSGDMGQALDRLPLDAPGDEVWPVIVAAGKGSRARETGLDVPKPLANIAGVPAILRVLRNVGEAVGGAREPVVIVSPDTEQSIRSALSGEEVTFVVQPEALGTGDAVLRAHEHLRDFRGRLLVVWGTQPALRPLTIRRTLKLAALFDEYDLVLPTVLKKEPYAPILRDERGRVLASRETHLEKAARPPFGETNVGLFAPLCGAMFEALLELRRRHWNESERRYERPGGELGFPNELINHLAGRVTGVFACPIADSREGQGIKEFDDVARCERIIAELRAEEG